MPRRTASPYLGDSAQDNGSYDNATGQFTPPPVAGADLSDFDPATGLPYAEEGHPTPGSGVVTLPDLTTVRPATGALFAVLAVVALVALTSKRRRGSRSWD